ncbi:MAG: glycosyltransferase [Candidatus Gracilibacteria bacterium]|jgi:glycosyltransferase involved in cell wall biosynthesis
MKIQHIKRNKPRVALLINTWFPVHTGQQVYTAKLAEALARDYGYEVDILTRAIKGRVREEQREVEKILALRITRFGFKSHPWNLFMQAGYLIWVFFHLLIKGQKYSLYHAQGATVAAAMKAASWFTRVPTVVTVHGNHVFEKSWTLKKIIHRIMFLETKYTQEVSIAENFLKAVNVNEHIAVIPYGVDTEPFDQVEEDRSPDQFNALFVGRIDFQKGLDNLFKAVKKTIESTGFIQSHKDFMLHLVGDGPDRKGLEKLAHSLGIEKYLRWHGYLTGEALIHLYKSCDLFVLPSRNESFPLSVLEACAARLPILATRTGDLHNIVLESTNGHLVEPDDIDELAYYLEYFAGNPHLEKLGQGSYDLVTQEYSWDKTLQKSLRVYEQVMMVKLMKENAPHTHYFPWEIPRLLWDARGKKKLYRGKAPLCFCLTANISQAHLGEGLPAESEEIPAFIERFSEFCAHLQVPSTLFVQQDLLGAFPVEIKNMQELGHELGIQILEHDWLTAPMRRSVLRALREELNALGLSEVRMVRVPAAPSEQDLEILHEAGFEWLPTSEDPYPSVEFHWGIPFAHFLKMNLRSFLELEDQELLEAVNRLRAEQKDHGVNPFVIFECDSAEFTSREDLPHAGGENFTELSKKIAFLKEHMDLDFHTLSEFCKSCRIPSKL